MSLEIHVTHKPEHVLVVLLNHKHVRIDADFRIKTFIYSYNQTIFYFLVFNMCVYYVIRDF